MFLTEHKISYYLYTNFVVLIKKATAISLGAHQDFLKWR